MDEDGEDGAVSEDSSRRRRGSDDDDARPVTAAGRRRRADADGDEAGDGRRPGATAKGATTGGKGSKGTATPTRDRTQTAPQGSPIARLQRFLREVVAELRKVHWPTRRQIVVYTFVVLVFVAFMVSLVAGLDWVFAKAVFALFG
ncbi:MAG: preprotein translocase, SecE subunit [Actinomycetospora sp.]|nr:preprotein translocase, SecE subunit [Actinomycetospora sp.]